MISKSLLQMITYNHLQMISKSLLQMITYNHLQMIIKSLLLKNHLMIKKISLLMIIILLMKIINHQKMK
jgi:uncharacterized membrane protein